jgi:hypothetical protein
MTTKGFLEYKRREFCKDVQCPVQLQLNALAEASPNYEQTRQKCSSGCSYTTWQFHHWLIEKGYIILVSLKLKNNQRTVLANLDNKLVEWIDQQVKAGNYHDRSEVVESVLNHYKKRRIS